MSKDPKKSKPQGDKPATGKSSVKLASDLHRKARLLAAYYGKDLADFLDEQLRPIVDRMYSAMAREMRDETD